MEAHTYKLGFRSESLPVLLVIKFVPQIQEGISQVCTSFHDSEQAVLVVTCLVGIKRANEISKTFPPSLLLVTF